MNLFSEAQQPHTQPLAYRMRPRTLDEYIGQDHIIGKGRLLRRAIQADQLSSVIFYGPPGTGKTTLARVIANTTRSRFITLNAVLSGVKELRLEIEQARERLDLHGTRTILFIDEVHRWNKSQQDALLPWVESGMVILIGATTENPYFEVNSALVSRSRIFQLKKLSGSDLLKIAEQALSDSDRGYGKYSVEFEKGALEHLVEIANGDARSLLNALQLAVETSADNFPPTGSQVLQITRNAAEESIQQKVVLYDKEGDYHFDVISAFIKSIRGSDPDAALYWLARMVRAGENPRYIFRRMLISASEDIGIADPQALGIVESAAAAFDRVGLPEGRFHLTQAALYLAAAPKSNSTLGFFDALKTIETEEDSEVPNHLKDGSRDKKGFGHGEGYLYPHAYRDHWTAQQYLPTGLQGKIFYRPSDQGFEKSIRDSVFRKREAQIAASDQSSSAEILTFSPPDNEKAKWLQRLISGRGNRLADIRERIFAALDLPRHARILIPQTASGLLLWESCRHVPEGGVYGFTDSSREYDLLNRYIGTLTEEERPILIKDDQHSGIKKLISSGIRFEAIVGYDLFTRLTEKTILFSILKEAAAPDGSFSFAQTIPALSTRLSQLSNELPTMIRQFLTDAEQLIYQDPANPLINWNAETLLQVVEKSGFTVLRSEVITHRELRQITPLDLGRWLEKSYLPAVIRLTGSSAEHSLSKESILEAMVPALCSKPAAWETQTVITAARAGC
jgi:putative ATPase